MSEPFLSEIKIMSCNFAPKGWALCNGQTLQINQNQALFSLLGTMYGGNGQTTFALPDLRGRIPISMGPSNTIGTAGGSEFVTLNTQTMAAHNHGMMTTTTAGNAFTPGGAGRSVLAQSRGPITPTGSFPVTIYSPGTPNNSLSPGVISNIGGTQPHENRMPYLVLSYCISLNGIFPSRN